MSKSSDEAGDSVFDFAMLQGVWRSRGYGNLLEIGPEGYTVYEETRVSCLPVFAGSLDELAEHYVDVRVSPRRQTFDTQRAAGVARVGFRRLKALPHGCTTLGEGRRSDPEFNFEVFWQTFAEHYALFDLKAVDWQSVYSTYRLQVSSKTKQARLFEIFVEMLRPLADGHVQLHTTCGHFTGGATIPLYDRLAAELDKADDTRDVASYLADLREALRDRIREDYLQVGFQRTASGHLEWGRLNGDTGYLAIRAMAGLSGRVGRPRLDLQAADKAMKQVIEQLGQLRTMVVDLRGNAGGYDAVALRLAGYLTDRKRLAFSKSARYGTSYTGKQNIYVQPSQADRYKGRLIVLTSGLTASAAEVFVLALLQHPQLTLIGEPTHGILSDAMERHLPNRWFLTLSNEIYHAFDGELYEDCGIPPHIEIPFLAQDGRESGCDPMLDYILDSACI